MSAYNDAELNDKVIDAILVASFQEAAEKKGVDAACEALHDMAEARMKAQNLPFEAVAMGCAEDTVSLLASNEPLTQTEKQAIKKFVAAIPTPA